MPDSVPIPSPPDSSFTDREQLLAAMQGGESLQWDLIIVGGGITGAGVLREAARRGYRALLLEQRDFAWGTSSRSSKMVHGGLRYLAQGDFKLTRHSVQERERLLREAPGLVERMGYYFTLRKGKFPGRFIFSTLLWLYDRFAGISDHRFITPQAMLQQFPGLCTEGLKGAGYYTDAVTDDARLVLRVLQESCAAGGSALNYMPVQQLLLDNGTVSGVKVNIAGEDKPLQLRAPVVINATGAWADRLRKQVYDEPRVRPLRGSHLVLPGARLPVPGTLALTHPEDGRSVFIFPWEGTTVVGTTDLDDRGDLNTEASITAQEVDYLLAIVNSQFPNAAVSRSDITSTWAGVRPVIGSEKSRDPSRERRDHAVWSDRGLVTVSGGKLTTFRLIAEDALDAARALLPAPAPFSDDRVFAPLTAPQDSADSTARRLQQRYGDAATAVLASADAAELATVSTTSYSLADCRWAARHEAVRHLDDLLLRRTRLGLLLPHGGAELYPALEKICAAELGWDGPTWQSELARYRDILARHYSVPDEGASADAH